MPAKVPIYVINDALFELWNPQGGRWHQIRGVNFVGPTLEFLQCPQDVALGDQVEKLERRQKKMNF